MHGVNYVCFDLIFDLLLTENFSRAKFRIGVPRRGQETFQILRVARAQKYTTVSRGNNKKYRYKENGWVNCTRVGERKRTAIESIGRYLPSIAPSTMAGIIVTASDTFDLVPARIESAPKNWRRRVTKHDIRHVADTRRQFSYLARSIHVPPGK